MRRATVGLVTAVAVAWVAGTTYAAAVISGGGGRSVDGRDPASVGLAFRSVTYAPGRAGWYVPGTPGRPVIVVVHGFGNDRSATVGVGPPLHDLGYGLLFVDLGYVSGTHPYGGGHREAADVADAVTWVKRMVGAPVVLLGFSAGALASLSAAAGGAPVAAVVSDSGFVGFRDAVAYRARLSRVFTRLLPVVYPLVSRGGRVVDLARQIEPDRYRVPTLVIHGRADRTVPPASGKRIAELTGARLWELTGVGHAGAFHADQAGWVARVDELIRSAVSSAAGPGPAGR